MNDAEIIKALECCGHCECNDEKTQTECPLINMTFCKNYLRKQSLDLINRQKAEIESLQNVLSKWKDIAHRETSYVGIARTEAIKEFAERMKAEARYFAANVPDVREIIDNLVEEKVGETE